MKKNTSKAALHFDRRRELRSFDAYPDVLTVEEAAELLGVCTKTIYSMIRRGELQKQSVGRLFRIPKAYILHYLGIDVKE